MGPTSKTTPSPPASSTTATVVQKLTLSITAAQYTGNVKTVMETAVGIVYKIFVNNAWLTMLSAQGAAANTAATGMTVTTLATAATQAKSALGASYANTTIPTVSNIQTASCTGICTTTAGVV